MTLAELLRKRDEARDNANKLRNMADYLIRCEGTRPDARVAMLNSHDLSIEFIGREDVRALEAFLKGRRAWWDAVFAALDGAISDIEANLPVIDIPENIPESLD
jgi:hypothetical protein